MYGLALKVPGKLEVPEKQDERKLRRHLVKAGTSKLLTNIEKFEA